MGSDHPVGDDDAHPDAVPSPQCPVPGVICVYTNNTYAQAMRGYGNPQATFAIESSMDMLAGAAGIDPVEFRRINANQSDEVSPQGFRITTCGLTECIDKVVKEIGATILKRKAKGSGMPP